MATRTFKYLADRSTRIIFELVFVLGLLGVLASSAITGQQHAVRMSSIMNSLSAMAYLKTQILYHQVMYGRWPDSRDIQDKIDEVVKASREIESIDVDRGNVAINYNTRYKYLSGHKLAFRKAQFTGQYDTPIIWLCGNQAVPEGMQTDRINLTDLPADLLPRLCK